MHLFPNRFVINNKPKVISALFIYKTAFTLYMSPLSNWYRQDTNIHYISVKLQTVYTQFNHSDFLDDLLKLGRYTIVKE